MLIVITSLFMEIIMDVYFILIYSRDISKTIRTVGNFRDGISNRSFNLGNEGYLFYVEKLFFRDGHVYTRKI